MLRAWGHGERDPREAELKEGEKEEALLHLFENLAAHGDAVQMSGVKGQQFFTGLVASSNLQTIKGANQMGCCFSGPLASTACVRNKEHGLDILQWLVEQGHDSDGLDTSHWLPSLLLTAAAAGHLPILQWLTSDQIRSTCLSEAFSDAAMFSECLLCATSKGHMDVLAWLKHHPRVDRSLWRPAVWWAAESGNPIVIRWLHANVQERCTWDAKACAVATVNGNLSCLQLLRSKRIDCYVDVWSCPSFLRDNYAEFPHSMALSASGTDIPRRPRESWEESTLARKSAADGGATFTDIQAWVQDAEQHSCGSCNPALTDLSELDREGAEGSSLLVGTEEGKPFGSAEEGSPTISVDGSGRSGRSRSRSRGSSCSSRGSSRGSSYDSESGSSSSSYDSDDSVERGRTTARGSIGQCFGLEEIILRLKQPQKKKNWRAILRDAMCVDVTTLAACVKENGR